MKSVITPDTERAHRLTRRDILRIGIQTPIMMGIGSQLIREARGAPGGRQGLITFVTGAAMPYEQDGLSTDRIESYRSRLLERDPNYFSSRPETAAAFEGYVERFQNRGVLPPSLFAEVRPEPRNGGDQGEVRTVNLMEHTFEGPFAAFESRKDRMLFFNRLYCTGGAHEVGGWSHGGGCRVLTAHGTGGVPYGPSIDQHIAQVIGRDSVESSIRICVDRHSAATFRGDPDRFRNLTGGNFAFGRDSVAAGYSNPQQLLSDVFRVGEAADPGEPDVQSSLRPRVFDAISADIRRLSGSLAGSEKAKMDQFLAEIENFASRQEARRNLTCDSPGTASVMTDPHEQATFMIRLGSLAMRCGLTNVLSVALGTFYSSHEPLWTHRGYLFGHTPIHYGGCYEFWNDYSQLMAEVMDELDQVQVGEGTLGDRTALMMMGDCGVCWWSQHVGEMKPSWMGAATDFPILLIAPTGTMNGGLFIHHPEVRRFGGGESGLQNSPCESQASVFATLGEVMGAPGFSGDQVAYPRVMSEYIV